MPSRLVLAPALLAVVAVSLLGCGGGGGDDYADGFAEVAEPLTAELIDLGNAMGVVTSREQAKAALERGGDAVDEATAGFEALEPPDDDVAETQEVLISALGAYRERIEETAEEVRAPDNRRVERAIADFNAESQAFASALAEIRSRLEDDGIDLETTTVDAAG